MAEQQFRHVWVIQEKSSGRFLTPHLYLAHGLKFAGRCEDYQSALDTADMNLDPGDFVISDFWEQV